MATRRLSSKSVAISWDRDLPRLVQAASVALAVLTHVKLRSIGDLKTALDGADDRVRQLLAEVRLSDEARQLLTDSDIAPVLGLLRARTNKADGRQHMLTVAVCPVCGEWSLVGGAGGPARCLLRGGCSGRPVKAVPGSRRRVEDSETSPSVDQKRVAADDAPGLDTAAPVAATTELAVPDEEDPSGWDRPGPDDGLDDPFG